MAAGATAAPRLLVSLLSFLGARSGGGSGPLLAGAQQQHQSSNLGGVGKRGGGVRGGKWEGTGAFQNTSVAAAAAVTESRAGTSLTGAGASASATTAQTVPADEDYLTPTDFEGPRSRFERRTPGRDSRKYSGFSSGVVDVVGGGSGGNAESDGREGGPPPRESPNVGLLSASGARLSEDGRDHSGGWHDERCWPDHETGRYRCQANVFLFGVSKCGEIIVPQQLLIRVPVVAVSRIRLNGKCQDKEQDNR